MKLIEHVREGFTNLYFSKLRSLLAVLGVLVGTASVVAMVMGGQLATNEALKQFRLLGTDLLAVSIATSGDEDSKSSSGKVENLSLADAFALHKADPAIRGVAPYTQSFQPILYNGTRISAITLGVTDSLKDMIKIKLLRGRFVSTLDKYNFYCAIGHQVYEAIKKITFKDPIGQSIQLGKNIFVIVGILDTWPENGFIYGNINNAILVPIEASFAISKYAAIGNIIFRLKPDANIDKVEDNIEAQLKNFLSNKSYNFRSAQELIEKMEKQSDILTVFLGLIGSISLIVGGIGVMNIMLVSVVERKREIGIRLAVGARRRDISTLFLIEAIMLALVGGVLGVIIGILIAYIIALTQHWQFTLFLWPPLVGFSVSVFVGIFFGFYPAFKASKLNPIEALRSD